MSPLIVAVEMGYGHLRPAAALAATVGVPLGRADLPPLASPAEARAWALALAAYMRASRWSQVPGLGLPFRWGIDAMTAIHGEPDRPHPGADPGCLATAAAIRSGLGQALVDRLRTTGAPLLTTFYLPALAADAAGLPAWCVVTDTDCARAWAPVDAAHTHIRYCAPTARVRARLESYGVPAATIRETGFPLPPTLTADAERTQADRLERLRGHGGPARLLLSIGGAGAQAAQVEAALPGLLALVDQGRLQLTLAVGTHAHLARRFRGHDRLTVLTAATVEGYLPAFDAALGSTDLLWTKPSELVFYAALGLPLLLAPPIGAQEHANLAHVRPFAVDASDPGHLAAILTAGLADGSLARTSAAAWAALPRDGAATIAAWIGEG